MRVDHEKKSDGERVDNEKNSDGVRVHHEKEQWGELAIRKSDGVRADH